MTRARDQINRYFPPGSLMAEPFIDDLPQEDQDEAPLTALLAGVLLLATISLVAMIAVSVGAA